MTLTKGPYKLSLILLLSFHFAQKKFTPNKSLFTHIFL